MTKHVFITGGVVSGLGKGITASSLGRLLTNAGLRVSMQKFDPYLNVDPGTMSPYQHGEVFVTEDGGETDLDLGHYERFININLSKLSSVSSGQIYLSVIEAERRGDWEGKTIQVIPHITDAIKNKVYAMEAKDVDVVITEIGGTVGDIEAQAFIEAIRQIRLEQGRENVIFVHLGLVLYLHTSQEFKTKPLQHSVKELLTLGIQPDVLIARSETEIPQEILHKLALFTNVAPPNVITAIDVDSIYKVPEMLGKQNLHKIVMNQLKLKAKARQNREWKKLLQVIDQSQEELVITFVGKYIEMPDAYLSIIEALKAAGWAHKRKIKIDWIQASELNKENYHQKLKATQGILIPGGFGQRGIEGMKLAVRYARENNVPYFGICLGMQIASIEFAENVLKQKGANSKEFNPQTPFPVFDYIRGSQKENLGGTLRLGKMAIDLKPNSLAQRLYGASKIFERHRHRYEFNNALRPLFEEHGAVFSGNYRDLNLVEIIELPKNDFFLGVQYHPEFISRPNLPHPLFKGFIAAIVKRQKAFPLN